MSNNKRSGFGYFLAGFSLIQTKGIKRYVFIPLLINILLFTSAFSYAISQLGDWYAWVAAYIPSWLSWLEYIFYPLTIMLLLFCCSLVFSMFANWLAAPFNGVLSERIEAHLTGQLTTQASPGFIADIPRALSREWCKFRYYLPRALGFLCISFLIPGIGQVIWLLFSAWMMAIQYCDYPFDNHQIAFDEMKQVLRSDKPKTFGFGISVSLFTLIPIVNLVVMPVAICGATLMWVENWSKMHKH